MSTFRKLPLVLIASLLLLSACTATYSEQMGANTASRTPKPAAGSVSPTAVSTWPTSDPAPSTAGAENVAMTGINLSSAEFGDCTDRSHQVGVYDDIIAGADYYLDKGVTIIRLPFCWERLQNQLFDPLNPAELAAIHKVVNYVTERNAYLLLDPHNYARYDNQIIGVASSSVTQRAFADFWARLATEFSDNQSVIFGLMNEPHDMSTELWVADANAAIAAIRNTGATNQIFLPGNGWTGAHSWDDHYYGTPNATAMLDIVDPIDNFAIEVHQYLDADSSGHADHPCVSNTIGSERLAAFTAWLHEHDLRGFLGEFGGSTDSTCLNALDNMLAYIDANADVWLGWTYWAGGPWWGNYSFSLEPLAGVDRPQMDILENYFSGGLSDELLNNPGFEAPYEELPAMPDCPNISGDVTSDWFDNSCWEENKFTDIKYAMDTSNPHDGTAAQRIQVQDGIMQIAQMIPLETGKLYTAAIQMRAQEPMSVTILLRKAEFPYTYFVRKTVTVSTQWEQYTLNGLTITTDGFFMVYTDSQGTLWLDDASLTATEAPPAPLPVGPIPPQYFGIHIHSAGLPWPHSELSIGAVRLWDASGDEPPFDDAQWAAINTASGIYDWTTLDLHVDRALANGADIVFNLGRTPQWASARPDEFSPYDNGQAAEPADDQYWRDWVTAVGTRYKGKITYWEIWNEPNYEWFWTGSPEKLVSLAQQAYDILKAIDSGNQIVSPSPYDLGYLDEYLSLGGGDYADIIGYHFYLAEGEEPEYLYESYVPVAKYILGSHGLADKPLWDTENGWPGRPLPSDIAVGYVARSYLLDWAAGISRYYFYSWDNGEPVVLADPPGYNTLNPVGVAYRELSEWLIGSRMIDISTGADDTWTIQLARADGTQTFVVWNPSQTVAFDIPFSWDVQQLHNLAGAVIDLDGVSQVMIDQRPILLE